MATTRIMPLHVGKGRTESRAISDIIDYVANPKKTDNGRLITGWAQNLQSVLLKAIMPLQSALTQTSRTFIITLSGHWSAQNMTGSSETFGAAPRRFVG